MADQIEITKEQIALLVKKIVELPDDKIQYKTYDDHPDIIQVWGTFPEGKVGFRFLNRDSRISIEIAKNNQYSATTRTLPIPKSFKSITRLFSSSYNAWRTVLKRAEKKRYNESQARKNAKVQELSVLIDQVFPDVIEKELLK